MAAYASLVQRALKQSGAAKGKFAEAIGVNPTRFSRMLKGNWKNRPNIVKCLEIAKITGDPASVWLRACGHRKIADLIEELFGPDAVRRQAFLVASGEPPLSLPEADVIKRWRRLVPGARRSLRVLLEELSKEQDNDDDVVAVVTKKP